MATVEEPKPAVTTDAGVVEPTPAPAETLTADKPAEAVEPTTEEPAKTEAEPVAAAEEKKEEKAEEKPIEPVYSGALGYKAPGLKNAFRYSKKYFWFGEEPVPVQSLSHYLRGEKAEIAHPTAAWSSQTGKGLLYFVKHADQKETPAGVLNLAEATELTKDGIVAFHFKLHGHKHAFEGATKLERDGWYIAVEKAVEDAKAAKESIVGSESYKEEIGKLNKPALAAAVAKNSTPKKSVDAPKPAEAEASTSTEVAAPARTGSSSSSSSDEEKKKKKASKSKSRSVSRGKRASIFGGFFGNKDKEEKKEEKKDEEEAKKEETPIPAAEPTAVSATAPVITEDIPKVGEELKNETTIPAAEPVAATTTEAPKEETKPAVEEKPKPTKRGSIFGSFVEKLKSPTTEKKESEVVPAPPAKEPETTAEAPKVEEPVTAAPIPADVTAEAPKEEKKEGVKPATTPAKEKQHFSFGKFLGGAKEKVKSPSTEKSPVEAAKTTTEEPAKAEETPAPVPAAPIEPAAEAPKEEAIKPAEEAPATTTPAATKPKRGSIFGNLTGSVKKEKEGEASDKPKGLSGLFRQASKAGKSKKEKEPTTSTPPKVEEETATTEPAKEEKKEETPVATEPTSIGDVVPSAISVGEAPKSTPQVSASA
ncbi:Pleckstrin homology domain-containing protein [Lophiotrema nucula]|uniref:Pleckstrin homology domain-containing protein n=1 Tax=Lophiotrema nucula TaxID=690887 RepID=A0A6A5ZRG5_9PLEO|nr:Pleckstrin homology domain-containing protein [Lophiotrema nucula]